METQPPVPAGRRERKKLNTRDALLRAAQEVLLERGYHDAGVDDIADRADAAVGCVYTYFGSKQGMFRALVERAIAEDEAAMDDANVETDPVARLDAMRQAIGRLHSRNPVLSALALASGHGGAPTELTAPVLERTLAELARLEEVIRDGIAAGVVRDMAARDAALFLWAAWSGLTALRLRRDRLGISDEAFASASDVGFRIMATGLLHRPTQSDGHAARSATRRRRRS